MILCDKSGLILPGLVSSIHQETDGETEIVLHGHPQLLQAALASHSFKLLILEKVDFALPNFKSIST